MMAAAIRRLVGGWSIVPVAALNQTHRGWPRYAPVNCAGGTGVCFPYRPRREGYLCRGKLLPAAALRLDSPRGGAYLNGYVASDSFFDFLVIAPRPGAGAHDPRGPSH